MHENRKSVRVRFTTSHGTMSTRAGHQVRTLTERTICDWLTERRIDHKHASEVFIVRAPPSGSPTLFVPDIFLSNKTGEGKPIIIETLHNFSPKRGGLKAFAAFCRQYRDSHYSILVAKKSNLGTIPRNVCNARVELENLDALAKKLSGNS